MARRIHRDMTKPIVRYISIPTYKRSATDGRRHRRVVKLKFRKYNDVQRVAMLQVALGRHICATLNATKTAYRSPSSLDFEKTMIPFFSVHMKTYFATDPPTIAR